MLKNTGVFPAPSVATTGQSLISHAGLNVLASFIDAFDFRDVCEDRLGQFVPSGAMHRPGTILGSLALMLAAGGEHVSDLDILRPSPGVFGKVASNATVSRFFERTVANPDRFDYGFATMTRELRSRVWAAAGDRNPALRATAMDPLIIDLDATLVTSHSDKEQAVGTYKGGYGFAPFVASIDYGTGRGTGEILAVVMRPGNAGANSADDHIKVFAAAVAQLPDDFYDHDGALIGEKILVRTDSAGASRKFLHHLASVGCSSVFPTRSRRPRPAWWAGSATNSTGNRPSMRPAGNGRTRGS